MTAFDLTRRETRTYSHFFARSLVAHMGEHLMLADLGADVIKVEGPEGDGLRGLHGGFLAGTK